MCEWENPAVALACNVGWVFFVYHEQCIAPCLLLLLLGVPQAATPTPPLMLRQCVGGRKNTLRAPG